MSEETQANAALRLSTPLGADALIARALDGREALSTPFEYGVEAALAEDGTDVSDLPGQSADVTLVDGEGGETVLNGVIWSVRREKRACRLVLRPWLSRLSLTSDNRIFQEKTAVEILEAVFGEAEGAAWRMAVTATPPVRPYCVQFGETDLAFVSRLMEAEGLGYFFEHAAGAHTLVVFDDVSACPPMPGDALPFLPLRDGGGFAEDRALRRLAARSALAPGKVAARDFAFETPDQTLEVSIGDAPRGLYLYPGGYDATATGQTVARRRLEAHEAEAVAVEGATPWRPLGAGHTFAVQDADDPALNATMLTRAVRRRAERNRYEADIDAQPADTPWRPAPVTPRPRMHGPQTAIVTGPSGEEIWTDKHGRIRVQFHWDRQGAHDENASCWLRVAQIWAGAGWGAFALPRVGMEVVVSFLDGDPDRPLVTGVVYNGANPPPYALPAEQTKTTLKSDSSKDAEGSNELRFEDKAGEEEVFLHAQKDLTVTVENARAVTVKEGDDSLTLDKGSRTTTITEGDETVEIGGKRTVTVTGDETRENKAKVTHHIVGDVTVTIDGDLTLTVGGKLAVTAQQGLNLKSGAAFSISAGGGFSLSAGSSAAIAAGTSVEITGGTTVTVKGSASAEVSGGGMLALKGGLVKVN
jgi:type VI secretion system secreted protein VgrG